MGMMPIVLLVLPAFAALIIASVRAKSAGVLAFATSLIVLAVSLVIANFNVGGGVQFATTQPWIASLGINFSIGMDGISLLLVLLTTVLTPFIILSSFKDSTRSYSFYSLILLMQSALIGVFIARDGFLFYVFWEMALVPIWLICLLWGGEGRGKITLKFFIYTLSGSLFMLIALVFVYLQTPGAHTFDIQALYETGRSLPAVQQSIIFWAMFLAFAIKMPVFPFHTWQPDTYAVAPAQGTMLLSAIMLKMGIYGLMRWLLPLVPMGVQQWGELAIILSLIGIIYASCLAIVQNDFKRLIAYSSIAHVGLIAAGVFTLTASGLQGAMIQMLSHGVVVFALFYIVDIISERTNTRTLSELGGIRHSAPVLTSVFMVVMLASVALPLTSGFVGEFLLITSLGKYKMVTAAVAGVSIILGPVYMLRGFQRSMLGEAGSRTENFADLDAREKIILFSVVVMIVAMGIFPGFILRISEPAVSNLLDLVPTLTSSIK